MRVKGANLLVGKSGTVKFLLNDSGIVFFPSTQQHREVKVSGLSYEDDYRGDAVAGLVLEGRVEIRFHNAFSDHRIKTLWARVLAGSEIPNGELGPLFYQGREIAL